MHLLPPDSVFNLTILFIFIIFLLGFAVLLASIYGFLSKWLRLLKEDEISGATAIKQNSYKQAAEILDKARKESLKIIAETNMRSRDVLGLIDNLAKESKRSLNLSLDTLAAKHEEALQKTSNELLSNYQDIIEKQKQESISVLDKVSSNIEKNADLQVDEFEDALERKTIEVEKLVEDKLDASYKKVEGEIAVFRDAQLKKATESIYDILHQVSIKVFGKVLSVEDHEDIVMQALNDAKNGNFFKPTN
ncbi:hypothetical protein HYV31_00280 [candidate division WWE3 bacterium]|nr:hypothetical protein [candidate division WWE3 bacterium]